MARIKWKTWPKLENKAIGLPGPRISCPPSGSEMDVPDEAIKKLAEKYGEDAFEVIKEPAKAPDKGKSK